MTRPIRSSGTHYIATDISSMTEYRDDQTNTLINDRVSPDDQTNTLSGTQYRLMTKPIHSSGTEYRVTYAVPVAKASVQRAVVIREQRADLL